MEAATIELLLWIGSWILLCLFWLWISLWGGAEFLEGTFLSGFLLFHRAPQWSAEDLRCFGWIGLFFTTVMFVLGLIEPGLRFFLW